LMGLSAEFEFISKLNIHWKLNLWIVGLFEYNCKVNQKHFTLRNTLVTATGLIGIFLNYDINRNYTNIKTEEKWDSFV
jgi:hypothetical protein